ncbi:MAG: alpha/beta hydrolase [Novosphingobium sp.]|nr:alpha/beta hydrolase [Novosphingobium sp.]
MPMIDVNGVGIAYEIIGNGSRNAIITPGGRFPKETPGVRDLAENLAAQDYKVVIWDRPNCGESDICFTGETESILNADTLVGLLKALDMAPALVIGGSAGSRVSLIAAHRHPDAVRKLAVVWITGDAIGLSGLVGVYCGGIYAAAKVGGMAAVAEDPGLAEAIERNPGNRDRVLGQDVDKFCETMQIWGRSYLPEDGSPVPGLRPKDYGDYKMPVLIFRSGESDPHHPRYTTEQVHALIPGSQMVEPPWGDREWIDRMLDPEKGLFLSWGQLAPQLVEFDSGPD